MAFYYIRNFHFIFWPAAPAQSNATMQFRGGAIGLSAPTPLAGLSCPKAAVASLVASSPKAELQAGGRAVPLLSLPGGRFTLAGIGGV